jgi:nucleotidyltransferase substrate binding protein (TIGR01987 family)
MINTDFLTKCINSLNRAYSLLCDANKESVDYDVYRSAVIKEFELSLEQSGKLLKYLLKSYFAKSSEVNKLTFKEIFKFGAKFGLIAENEVERWCEYRDNRNETTHEYGASLANKAILFMPNFIKDVESLLEVIKNNDIKK